MNKLLYIGLNGLAGSGKDTVARMLKTILSKEWESLEECKKYYFSRYTNPTQSATFPIAEEDKNSAVMCIAYADQLKEICASIFGIPVQRFYQNKSNAWICINDKFQYTEIKPEDESIVTSEDYYYNASSYANDENKHWMSLREILVYVGTYVLQQNINKQIFVNIVRNKIREEQHRNYNLKYVIVTDNRFNHELNYIYENNGITITINRNSVQQLDNIAEHELDDIEDYNYIIDNSGSYDELFKTIWDIVHNDVIFKNKTIELYTRDNIDNYLRLVQNGNSENTIYQLCLPYKIQKLYRNEGKITMIDPVGGPVICVGQEIEGTNITPDYISIDEHENRNEFLIWVQNNKERE